MISIVTVAYNASTFIGKAIESVRSQSFMDWEMVVVDDGSTDNTAEVVESYAKNDSRIRLVYHDANMGAGMARRTAIRHIRGEYMTFLDSDDYLKTDCLEVMHGTIVKYDVDIVSQGYVSVTPEGDVISERVPRKKVIQVGSAKFKPNEEDTKRFMNMMLIRSSLWDKVEYSPRRYVEDTPTLVQILYWAKSIMLIPYAGYYYVQRPESLVHSVSKAQWEIYRALCIKDMAEFFISVGWNHLANDEGFMREYEVALRMCTTDDKNKSLNELDELNSYYKRLKA